MIAPLVIAADIPTNRLIHEASPYLRQHAHNPVDWYPWGDDAFARARAENKPIFLSIGYSTCHWCHRMERESFADPEVARLLNEHFVCIKVDREERPDLDRIYQTFVQASTGSGGWPLTVWLTPQLKPFFGGTYFPRDGEAGRPGLTQLIARISTLWTTQRERVLDQSVKMLAALRVDTAATTTGVLPIAELRTQGVAAVRASYDIEHGGFGTTPKFPECSILESLLDAHATSADAAQRDEALRLALGSLRALTRGALHDTIGGGFHRYTVDAAWRVPHFEKMLYDQAQIASVCLHAHQITGDAEFRDAALDTLAYVQRRLTDPAGGFYAAEDADSAVSADAAHKREGACYVWRADEIATILGPELAPLFTFARGIEPAGNVVADDDTGFAGLNILRSAHTPAECAAALGLDEDVVRSRLAEATRRLRLVRDQRPQPHRDEKIITAWNGLMISALARAAIATGDSAWAGSARRAAQFVRDHLRDPASGELHRSICAGTRAGRAFAEDHAFLIQGLLDLYEATFEVAWLGWAAELQERQDTLFWDEAAGGYFSTTADDTSVVMRLKEDADGVEPSANSIAVRNLARLAELLHRDAWRTQARRAAEAFGSRLERDPGAMPRMLAALGWLERPPQRIVICGEAASAEELVAMARRHPGPHQVLLRIDAASRGFFESWDPLVAGYSSDGDSAIAYVCANFSCELPTSDPGELGRQLDRFTRP